jgi:predicted nucleic acid-binding protein
MYLFDTNIFLRLAIHNDAQRPATLNAVRLLRARNEIICFTPQILGEFWNVCTRPPAARGGFGLSIEQTEKKARLIEKHFRLLPDTLQTFQAWRRLVFDRSVSGVQVHDAKIAASMLTYGVTHLLTFNIRDFQRFGNVTVVAPSDIT